MAKLRSKTEEVNLTSVMEKVERGETVNFREIKDDTLLVNILQELVTKAETATNDTEKRKYTTYIEHFNITKVDRGLVIPNSLVDRAKALLEPVAERTDEELIRTLFPFHCHLIAKKSDGTYEVLKEMQ